MKTLTPKQRMEGFTELEGVLGEGGVGGAHLMSFLAGVAHAEKVLASQEQDDEPVAWGYQEPWGEITDCISNHAANEAETCGDYKVPLYLHPAPRPEFVRLTEEEMDNLFDEIISRTFDDPARIEDFGYAIQSALEAKNA